MTALVYGRGTFADVRACLALLQAHWDEVGHDKQCRRLDPDWDAFAALEASGQLYVLTARLPGDGGQVVGYVAAVIRSGLHDRTLRSAYVDAVYLSPEHRRAGVRLLELADAALASQADFIYWHVKPERDFGPVLQRRIGPKHGPHRYHFIESVWGRSTGRR